MARLLRLWRAFDLWVERAVLNRLSPSEGVAFHIALAAMTVLSFFGATLHPGAADQLLFVQFALVTFFLGLRMGMFWLLPTWFGYAVVVPGLFERLSFAAFCVYGLLIAGVTVWKFRTSRHHELQMSSALEIARQVQISLQPPPLVQWPQAEMASRVEAARELGGDLVCWQARPGGKGIFVLVGDVMGKGAQAALTAAYVKGLFDEVAQTAPDPAELLLHLHRHLIKRTVVDSFLAALCIEMNFDEKCWKVCRAGMPGAFIVPLTGEGPVTTPEPGIMLGVPLEPELTVTRVPHSEQERLFLASDGLLEEEEAPAELLSVLRQPGAPSTVLSAAIDCLLKRGAPGPEDDRTAVLIDWK